jgi:hypothetical protein
MVEMECVVTKRGTYMLTYMKGTLKTKGILVHSVLEECLVKVIGPVTESFINIHLREMLPADSILNFLSQGSSCTQILSYMKAAMRQFRINLRLHFALLAVKKMQQPNQCK